MPDQEKEKQDVDPYKPYKGRLESFDHIPKQGRDRDEGSFVDTDGRCAG